jgi:putative flippase GtrA
MVGASGFVVDLLTYFTLQSLLGIHFLWARALSYWVAASWNWLFNRIFTFAHRYKKRRLKQWSQYVTLSLIGFGLNWGTFYLLTSHSSFFYKYKALALIMGVFVGMFFNFTLARTIVFSHKQKLDFELTHAKEDK